MTPRRTYSPADRAGRVRKGLAALESAMSCKSGVETGFIYFISNGYGLVKVGHAGDIHGLGCRLNNARTWSPFAEVELIVHGTRKAEQSLHERWWQYRVKGEWFELDGAVREYVTRWQLSDSCEGCLAWGAKPPGELSGTQW